MINDGAEDNFLSWAEPLEEFSHCSDTVVQSQLLKLDSAAGTADTPFLGCLNVVRKPHRLLLVLLLMLLMHHLTS